MLAGSSTPDAVRKALREHQWEEWWIDVVTDRMKKGMLKTDAKKVSDLVNYLTSSEVRVGARRGRDSHIFLLEYIIFCMKYCGQSVTTLAADECLGAIVPPSRSCFQCPVRSSCSDATHAGRHPHPDRLQHGIDRP